MAHTGTDDVQAELVVVEGQVIGDLAGRKAVVVKSAANVTGNISSPTVTLNEGSTFNGNIDMSNKAKAKSAPPVSRPTDKVEATKPDDELTDQVDDSEAEPNRSAGVA